MHRFIDGEDRMQQTLLPNSLEDYVSEAEAKAYILMERKVRGMTILPGTVSVLRRYMQELGNKYESLIDFLPIFPRQLRIAKKIVTL